MGIGPQKLGSPLKKSMRLGSLVSAVKNSTRLPNLKRAVRERDHYKIIYIKGVQAGKDFEELRKQDAVTG